MSKFFIPSRKCYCIDHNRIPKEYGFFSINLYGNYLSCTKNGYVTKYNNEFTLALGFLLLKKFDEKQVNFFLECFPQFEKYDYKWIWENLKFYKFNIDENTNCFLKLLGFPTSFSKQFEFDDFTIRNLMESARLKRDYRFAEGEHIKLSEVPNLKSIKKSQKEYTIHLKT